MTYETPQWLVWVLIALGFIIAATLEYHNLRKNNILLEQEPKTAIRLQPRKPDYGIVSSLSNQMTNKHGHTDSAGIESDYRSGIDTNDILKRDCTKCGKPRNQRGENGDY